MIYEMQRCLATKPPHVRIRKWRVTYSEALGLANELRDMQGLGFHQTSADVLMSIIEGNATMFNIPVEVKWAPGQAYPIDPRFIRYSQPS